MGARKGRKHEMRVRVSECGGDMARAGTGAELWLEAFREMLLPGKARTPGRGPTFHGGGRGWGVGGGGDGRFHPLSVLRKRAKTPAGEEGRDLVRSPELF